MLTVALTMTAGCWRAQSVDEDANPALIDAGPYAPSTDAGMSVLHDASQPSDATVIGDATVSLDADVMLDGGASCSSLEYLFWDIPTPVFVYSRGGRLQCDVFSVLVEPIESVALCQLVGGQCGPGFTDPGSTEAVLQYSTFSGFSEANFARACAIREALTTARFVCLLLE